MSRWCTSSYECSHPLWEKFCLLVFSIYFSFFYNAFAEYKLRYLWLHKWWSYKEKFEDAYQVTQQATVKIVLSLKLPNLIPQRSIRSPICLGCDIFFNRCTYTGRWTSQYFGYNFLFFELSEIWSICVKEFLIFNWLIVCVVVMELWPGFAKVWYFWLKV